MVNFRTEPVNSNSNSNSNNTSRNSIYFRTEPSNSNSNITSRSTPRPISKPCGVPYHVLKKQLEFYKDSRVRFSYSGNCGLNWVHIWKLIVLISLVYFLNYVIKEVLSLITA